MSYSLSNVLNQESLRLRIWREDGVYIAKCLDIPGCVTQGCTHDEAMANIHDAVRLCLQVIQEDAGTLDDESRDVEIIDRPIEEFMRA
jgi:predicted RNase H-like HicB family nuclease